MHHTGQSAEENVGISKDSILQFNLRLWSQLFTLAFIGTHMLDSFTAFIDLKNHADGHLDII